MKLIEHFLEGENIERTKTPNVGGLFPTGQPDTILLHYTSGPSLDVAVQYFITPRYNVSTHLVIGKNGEIVQLVPFNKIAFHAGKSTHLDRKNLDDYAIGIEMDNAGLLQNNETEIKTWFGKEIKEEERVKVVDENNNINFWHKYTPQQLKVVEQICHLLKKKYNIKFLLGHNEVSLANMNDPGPAFPLKELREKLGL